MSETSKKDYVVMLDIHFLGIYVTAENEDQAHDLAIAALDTLKNKDVHGIEYGLRKSIVTELHEETE